MTKIILPFQETMAGFFHLVKHKADSEGNPIPGTAIDCVPEFQNLITDQGLERLGGSQGQYFSWCQVGSGDTPPANSDTALDIWVAGTNTSTGNFGTTQPSAPYYATYIKTFRFGAGVAEGNLSEIGIGWADDGPTLFSRALIVDGSGDPTTITILSDEILDVTYSFRVYPPTVDGGGTISIGGNSYDYISRAANVTNFAQITVGAGWGIFGGLQSGLKPLNSQHPGYTGPIGTMAGAPSGSNQNASSIGDSAYVPSSLYRDGTVTWGIDRDGLGGYLSTRVVFAWCAYQVQWDPVIPKTAINELKIVYRHSWARHTIP